MISKDFPILEFDPTPKAIIEPDEQVSSIEDYIEIIRSKFGQVDVSVYYSETQDIYDPARKASKSRPMKPAIYIE